jgi:anti-sigma B factor antagonist
MSDLRFEVEAPRRLAVIGEVDLSNADHLERRIEALLADDGDLILVLDRLAFIDSSGIRVLVTSASALHPRGRLVLASPSPLVARALAVVGLDGSGPLVVQLGRGVGGE